MIWIKKRFNLVLGLLVSVVVFLILFQNCDKGLRIASLDGTGNSPQEVSPTIPPLPTATPASESSVKGWHLLGPSSGRTTNVALLEDGNLIISTSSGGVFKQIDNHPTFSPINNGLLTHSSRRVWDIKNIDGKIYIATSDGICVLNSSHTAWECVYKGNEIQRIAADSSKRMWAMSFQKILKSDDGVTWQESPGIIDGSQFWDLLVNKNGDVYVVEASKGLFESKDQGSSWTLIGDKCNRQTTIDESGNLYCLSSISGESRTGLLKRNVGQTTWEKINDVGFMGGLAWAFGALIVSKEVGSLSVSTDKGSSFIPLSGGRTSYISQANAFWDINRFYFLSATKVLVPSDNGLVQVNISSNPFHIEKKFNLDHYTETYSFSLVGDTSTQQSSPQFLLGFQDHSAVFSKDSKWNEYPGSELSVFDSPLDGGNLHVQTDWMLGWLRLVEYPNKDIFFDSTCKPSPITSVNRVGFDKQSNPKIAYVVCNNSKSLISFRMTTDPQSLDTKKISLLWEPFLIAVDPTNGSRMVVMTSDKELYLSLNKGEQWSKLNWPRGFNIKSIEFNPFNPDELMMTLFVSDYTGAPSHNITFYKISQQSTTLFADPDQPGIDGGFYFNATYDPFENGLIYAGGQNGFFFSEDSGKSWKTMIEGLYGLDVRKIIPTQHRIYIGVWGSGIASISKNALLANRELIPCDYSYSNWSACGIDGQETRTLLSYTPLNCNSYSPVLSRTCVFLCPAGKVWKETSCETPSSIKASNYFNRLIKPINEKFSVKKVGYEFESKIKKREFRKILNEYHKKAIGVK